MNNQKKIRKFVSVITAGTLMFTLQGCKEEKISLVDSDNKKLCVMVNENNLFEEKYGYLYYVNEQYIFVDMIKREARDVKLDDIYLIDFCDILTEKEKKEIKKQGYVSEKRLIKYSDSFEPIKDNKGVSIFKKELNKTYCYQLNKNKS